ncbi:heavy-metal-associated domain-containing protein [Cuniculiplasma sp. SKW4]|uniref:heavy-metal-associated domain-containing protein n=1 Tax=Cuniculiplasma sp. SKW4 TaxID=3400171 RepID=UPI003FD63322
MDSNILKKSVYTVNMHCEGCANTIRKGLSEMDGIIHVEPILERKGVFVEYDAGKLSPGAIKEKIRNLGYSVE